MLSSTPTAWATGIASSLTTLRAGSKRCATSTPSCTHSSAPGGAYTAAVSAASTRVGSPPSSVPTYTPFVSGRPYATRKRKWRPSGRNCGQRCTPWPGASRVTGTGVPPVAITRIRARCRPGRTRGRRRGSTCRRGHRRGRQFLQAAASQIDPLQLAVGKKPNRAAIRRPERIAGTLGARERLRRHLVERPHPEPRRALGRCDERQLSAVVRQRERHRIARRWRGDLKARRKRLRGTRRKYSVAGIASAAITSDSAPTINPKRALCARGCVATGVAASSVAPLISSSI